MVILKTIANDCMTVYQTAKSNGLSKDQESALYTNGYVLKLRFYKGYRNWWSLSRNQSSSSFRNFSRF
jgi:hypothetical protein